MKIPSYITIKNPATIKKIPEILAAHAFLVVLVLILLDLVIGVFIFYQNDIVAKQGPSENTEVSTDFKYANYQKVLGVWQNNEQTLEESATVPYTNPFSAR
jgi:hypothetical protein